MVAELAPTEALPSVFVIRRSETGPTESVSVAELLPGVGSVVPVGAATEAALETLPEVALTLAETVSS